TRTRRSRAFFGATVRACSPSSSTKPPSTLRAALAELWRARNATRPADQSSPAARVAARASAANPDALDARPLDVGKSFFDTTRAYVSLPFAARTRSRSALARVASVSTPLISSESAVSLGSNVTVVVVERPASETERLGVAGTLMPVSRLPQ